MQGGVGKQLAALLEGGQRAVDQAAATTLTIKVFIGFALDCIGVFSSQLVGQLQRPMASLYATRPLIAPVRRPHVLFTNTRTV